MKKEIIAHSTKIVSDGYCISKQKDKKVLLIKGALPNETLRCRVLKETKSYILSEVKEVLEPSIHRKNPLCENAYLCGGCTLGYTTYEYQLKLKRDIVLDNLKRIAKLDISDIDVIPSKKSLGYRNRIRLRFKTGAGIGYFSYGTNRFVPIEKCLLARAPIRRILPYIFLFFRQYKPKGIEGQIELISPPKDNRVFCTIISDKKEVAFKLLKELVTDKLVVGGTILVNKNFFSYGYTTLKWPYNIEFSNYQKDFFIWTKPGCFSQINWQQNLKVINTIVNEAENIGCNKIVDLYAGFGNISIPISFVCNNIIAVEQNPLAIKALRENVKRLGILNIDIMLNKVERCVNGILTTKKDVKIIILDPPRTGAKEVIKSIKDNISSHIFYLSCSPVTFSRDIRILLDYNYKIKKIIAYDFFPQTHHVELLINLTNRH